MKTTVPYAGATNLKLPKAWEAAVARHVVTGKDADAKEALRLVRERRPELREELHRLENVEKVHTQNLDDLTEILEWMKIGKRQLQAPSDSAWYRLRDARTEGRFYIMKEAGFGESGKLLSDTTKKFFATEPHVFIMAHDWAAAFRTATDFETGEYPVPFDECVFEFQIDGRRVLVPTRKDESGEPMSLICFQAGDWWYCGEGGSLQQPYGLHDEAGPLYRLIYENVRALCIALDAGVAITEVVRAPHRLNHVRQKQGRSAINDYHVVNLAKRSRVSPLPDEGGEHQVRWHPRLHFRRGHWRHFENHKTWIKWMLVGDPDLGFIDKHYKA